MSKNPNRQRDNIYYIYIQEQNKTAKRWVKPSFSITVIRKYNPFFDKFLHFYINMQF